MTPVGDAFTLSRVLDESGKGRLERLPATAVDIIHGRCGVYLVLENGACLQVGSQLPDGGKVIDLTDRAIAIHYRGALINYPYDF